MPLLPRIEKNHIIDWAKPSVKTGLMKNNEYFYAT